MIKGKYLLYRCFAYIHIKWNQINPFCFVFCHFSGDEKDRFSQKLSVEN